MKKNKISSAEASQRKKPFWFFSRRKDAAQPTRQMIEKVLPSFDAAFYRRQSGTLTGTDRDLCAHYLAQGWQQGLDPAPWFSTRDYLEMNADVAASGLNPFLHYCLHGRAENRATQRPGTRQVLGGNSAGDMYAAHAFATAPGPHFEEFDPNIGIGRRKLAKVIAYYLPQFHPIEVNDREWGKGFTEWRQLARGLPRFVGHIQPRLPRDLGFYDLAEGDAFRRQTEMARAAGIDAFCFYHYTFDGQRILDTPMERFLADPTLDFQFCLMWANENWTRTWDGLEKNVILGQTYDGASDDAMIDDLARHMKDPRYVRIGDRPLFFIYRPGHIPGAEKQIAHWRRLFQDRHGLTPLLFMAQAFGDHDPSAFGMDGAIEFPPHKICAGLRPINDRLEMLDPNYAGSVLSYDEMVERSCREKANPFPLIRTVTPSWDNEARRPGRSSVIHGSTPAKFGSWLRKMIDYSVRHPVLGENLVCVNAWNEWAEGAVLEPDVHYGAAFLNELSRAVHAVPRARDLNKPGVLLVGHDAHAHGAQMLLLNIARTLQSDFGLQVQFLLGGGGPLLDSYRKLGPVHVAPAGLTAIDQFCTGLASDGWMLAITNTTPTGRFVPSLKRAGFRVVSLVHELPNLLASYGLQRDAQLIAAHSDLVVFPAEIVREGFSSFAGQISRPSDIFPQGLYDRTVLGLTPEDGGVRAELGLAPGTKIVLGVGYADLRKGIDRFVAAGLSAAAADEDIAFIWVGLLAREAIDHCQPRIKAAGLGNRVQLLGHRADVARLLAAANAFYLSSREDPFPSVVLEAMACGLPVVGHRGTGGCDAMIETHGTLVSQADPLSAEDALRLHLQSPDPESAEARRNLVRTSFDFGSYVFGLLQRLMPEIASVSAVVPNYNYERFIAERLNSIFGQTSPLREVVVLDDASSDDSIASITQVAATAGRLIDLQINPKNSGNVFKQWRKGVERAKGDYVWIAEADDLAAPDFVEQLVDRMQRAGSVLGFTDSCQIDETGEPLGSSYLPYINQIEAGAFDRPFDMAGPEFLARFLAVKNVILNVSGVIFHRQTLLDAIDAVGEDLFGYNVAGDWRLYVEICARQASQVTWLPEALNTHRRHRVSVTHSLKAERHLDEIRDIQRRVQDRVDLPAATIALQADHLIACEKHLKGNEG